MAINVRARNGIKAANTRPVIGATELPAIVGRRPRMNILTDG
jgi:hypothetical protein